MSSRAIPPPGANWQEFFRGRESEEHSTAVERIIWAFQGVNRGFHVREMLGEGYGPFEMQWALSGGNWKLRSDDSDYHSRSAERFPPEHEHPYWFGATQEETTVNSALWSVFQASPPVLGFSARQKRVFHQAVRGYSNASISRSSGHRRRIGYSCFRIVYDKIGEHPVLSAEMEDEARIEAGKARSRKREIFIDILRRHPEELRPWSTRPALKRTGSGLFGFAAMKPASP